uniref:Transcription repressor n=1 Tax=Fagus sylvatica TaxID=28930 RepID=A0A2N9I2D2_FAGSY
MPKKLQKSLHDYLTKMKKPTPHIQFPSNSFSSSKNWILSGCKHPKTLSFAIDSNQDKAGINDDDDDDDDDDNDDHDDNNKGAATLSDIDRFLLENFKSLYINEHEDVDNNGKRGKEKHEARMSVSTTSEDVGSTSTSTSTTQNDRTKGKGVMLPDDSIAVLAYSPSPYDDFRRSMQEIVEARMRNHGKVDWDFMEELLFCYLNLNEKKSYRYILSAFVDLIIVLRQNSDRIPERSRNVRTLRMIERERRRKMRRK